MLQIPFYKYQGLGNDFVLFDQVADAGIALPNAEVIQRICDRRFGIGADGLLFFAPASQANAVRMIYFNADGSRAETCFNGLRCIARHAVRSGRFSCGSDFLIETDANPLHASVEAGEGGLIRMEMPGPALEPERIPVNSREQVVNRELYFDGIRLTGTALSLGNPHFVVWHEEPGLDELNRMVVQLGATVEHSPHFPKGTNFELAHRLDDATVEMAVWERGVGRTLACGSGATATVCVGVITGSLPPGKPVIVRMAGGEIKIMITEDLSSSIVIGPAKFVFSGILDSEKWQ